MTSTAQNVDSALVGGGREEARAGAWHPIRTLLTGSLVLVPAHVFVVAGALVLAGTAAAERLPEGVFLIAAGAWSLKLVLAVFGVIAILIFTLLVLTSLAGATLAPGAVVRGVCVVVGAAILVAGHVGARAHRRPSRWRAGLAIVALTVAAAPWIFAVIEPQQTAAFWLALTAGTLLLIGGGLKLAFVSADRPT